MKTMEKRTTELLNFFAVTSYILVTVGCIVLPTITQILTHTNGITFTGVLVCITLYVSIVMMTSSINKQPKSIQSPTKRLVMRILVMLIGFFSIFFLFITLNFSLNQGANEGMVQINVGVQILSATVISMFIFVFCLSFYTIGKSTKDQDQVVIKDSFVTSYIGSIMVLISILVSCCVFESVFVMKNKKGFISWFGEIFAVISNGSSLTVSFTVEPLGVNTLVNLYNLITNDHTPLYMAGVLVLSMLVIPIKRLVNDILEEIKASNEEIKVHIHNSDKHTGLAKITHRISYPMYGFCPNCGKRVRLILLAPYDRTKIVFDESKIINDALEILTSNMRKKGVPFNIEDYAATYVSHDTSVKDRTGNVLFTPYACSICCSTVYPDFAGKRETGHGVVFVKLIGGRNSGKSTLAVSLYNLYKDTMMIESTPEYRYFEKMRLELAKGFAPEATNGNVLSSPVLMMKSGLKYISLMDVAGEHTQLVAASVQRRDTVAILVDTNNAKSIDDAVKALTFIPRKVRKIVIIITKIDKTPELDEMKVHVDNVRLPVHFLENIYNSRPVKKIRLLIKTKFDNEDKRTKRFLRRLESNHSFTALYKAASYHSSNVAIIANAGLGTGTNSRYQLQGKYNPLYLDETIKAFLE